MKNKLIAALINACAWFSSFQYFTVLAPALYAHGSSAAFNAMIALSIICVLFIVAAVVIGIDYWKESK